LRERGPAIPEALTADFDPQPIGASAPLTLFEAMAAFAWQSKVGNRGKQL
jgi:hypothetical protein